MCDKIGKIPILNLIHIITIKLNSQKFFSLAIV